MSYLKISVVLLSIILVFSCKKDDGGNNNTGNIAEKLATSLTLQQNAAFVYSNALQTSNDTLAALDSLGQWLIAQPEVSAAYYVGLNTIEIELANGLHTSMIITPTDANGTHLLRGGSSGALKRFSGIQAEQAIKNDKVLVLIPYLEQFYGNNWGKESQFQGGSNSAPQTDDLTVITGKNVTYRDLGRMDSAGLVILNTHGVNYGVLIQLQHPIVSESVLESYTSDDLTELVTDLNNLPYNLIENGQFEIGTQIERSYADNSVTILINLIITEEYIRSLNLDLNGTVVFGNHCFSGWTFDGPTENNMPEAWRSLGASAYYGYAFGSGRSVQIDNGFCKRMEDSLIANLVVNLDSTGNAHLDPNDAIQSDIVPYRMDKLKITRAVKLTVDGATNNNLPYEIVDVPVNFLHFFDDGYAYGDCPTSFTDPRDSTVYQTVCIGNQVWFAENLRYETPNSLCYDNDPSNCASYGRLYSFVDAVGPWGTSSTSNPSGIQGICPPGWHIPSRNEWQELADSVGGTAIAGKVLRSTTSDWAFNDDGTNEYGFNVLPAGQGFESPTTPLSFSEKRFLAIFLSCTVSGANADSYSGFRLETGEDFIVFGGVWANPSVATGYMPCRCIRD